MDGWAVWACSCREVTFLTRVDTWALKLVVGDFWAVVLLFFFGLSFELRGLVDLVGE